VAAVAGPRGQLPLMRCVRARPRVAQIPQAPQPLRKSPPAVTHQRPGADGEGDSVDDGAQGVQAVQPLPRLLLRGLHQDVRLLARCVVRVCKKRAAVSRLGGGAASKGTQVQL